MTIFELRHGIDHDDMELGIRVACALFVENVTEPDNFIRILNLRHRWVEDKRGQGRYDISTGRT